MTRSVSVASMIEQIDGLRETGDLSDWEDGFALSIKSRFLAAGKDSTALSAKQVETVERIWKKHFA